MNNSVVAEIIEMNPFIIRKYKGIFQFIEKVIEPHDVSFARRNAGSI